MKIKGVIEDLKKENFKLKNDNSTNTSKISLELLRTV